MGSSIAMRHQRWAAGLIAVSLAGLAACSLPLVGPSAQVGSPAATDRMNLADAVQELAALASVCVDDPPPLWSVEGLGLIARMAPAWLEALGPEAEPSGTESGLAGTEPGATGSAGSTESRSAGTEPDDSTGPGASGATCQADYLEQDLARSEALSLRLAETDPADPVPLAIWRALRACRAIGQDSVSLTSSPDLADLATLSAEELDDLALAEDQAGFIGEYLAALTQVGELRDALTQAAALHRARASGLAGMADSPDPRAVVYRLGEQPVDEATIRARWATAELALASHYAELPVTAQAEAFLCWQLAQAHAWGAELPDLPFLTPPAN